MKGKNKKHGVSRRTYDRQTTRFASDYCKALDDLSRLVQVNCKGNAKAKDSFMHALCKIIDRYSALSYEVTTWCHTNGVDQVEFCRDIMMKHLPV